MTLSLDDFGTGYSSLSHLAELSIDEIKIDKSFVMAMRDNDSCLAIVRSTIDLAHNLGLRCVAEGVEDIATWRLLAGMGCDELQGYQLRPAMPADELTRWFKDLMTLDLRSHDRLDTIPNLDPLTRVHVVESPRH